MSLLTWLRTRGYPDEELFFNPAQIQSCRGDTQSGASHGLPPVSPASFHRPDVAELLLPTRPGGGFPELVEK